MDNIKIHKSCEAMCITVSAFNDKNLIGSATCSTIDGTLWYFNRLFVRPNFRGNSYGSILLGQLPIT